MSTRMRAGWRVAGGTAIVIGAAAGIAWGASYVGQPDDIGSAGTTDVSTTNVDMSSTTFVSPGEATTTTVGSHEAIPVVEARGMATSMAGDILYVRVGHSVYAWDSGTLVRQFVMLTADDNSITIINGAVDGGPDLPEPYLREVAAYQAHAAEAISLGIESNVSVAGRSAVSVVIPRSPDPTLVELGLPYEISRTVAVDSETWAVVDMSVLMSDGERTRDDIPAGLRMITISRSELRPASAVSSGPEPAIHEGGFSLIGSFDDLSFVTYQPTWLPEGFVLRLQAYAARPISRLAGTSDVAVLTYRNQTAAITITFRPALGSKSWPDPWDPYGDGFNEGTYTYSGLGGEFVIVPPGFFATHAWGVIGDTLVTIDGALSTSDVETVIDSLGA